jgi:two-component system chemotaxis response regulator CheB
MGQKLRVILVIPEPQESKALAELILQDPEVTIVASCRDAYQAREALVSHRPDLMLLDLDLPGLDGAIFLQKVMEHLPTPTLVILARHSQDRGEEALKHGAVGTVRYPEFSDARERTTWSLALRQKIRQALQEPKELPSATGSLHGTPGRREFPPHVILAIAASTGGPEAVRSFLKELPATIPGTVVVLHMPAHYTTSYAEGLARVCAFPVKEAADGDRLQPGLVLVAPGDYHIELRRAPPSYRIQLHQGKPLHGVRPAADLLFHSIARVAAPSTVGLVLTGMGHDGAEGLKAMRDKGSVNFAEAEQTSVVFGMPKSAIEAGAIDFVLPLPELPEAVMRELRRKEHQSRTHL